MRIADTAVLVIAFYACGEAPSTPSAQVSDSAGVRIVQYTSTEGAPLWRVDTAAVLRLGGDGGDLDLFGVTATLQAADGSIVVADRGNHRILFFNRSGELERSIGREGEGPGEFKSINVLSLAWSDSLLVWDGRLRRLSVLDPSGVFVRSLPLQTTDSVPFASVVDVYADGSLVANGFVDTGDTPITTGRRSYEVPVYHFDRDGVFIQRTGRFPTGESYFEALNGGFRVGPALFGATALRAAAGNRLLAASADRYELRFYEPSGELSLVVRDVSEAVPVAADTRSLEIERLVDDAPRNERAWVSSILDVMEVPPTLPAIRSVFADRAGNVWVEPFVPGKPSTAVVWRVFASDGALQRRVELPGGFKPMDAGSDFIVGVIKNELGVESVVRYVIAPAS